MYHVYTPRSVGISKDSSCLEDSSSNGRTKCQPRSNCYSLLLLTDFCPPQMSKTKLDNQDVLISYGSFLYWNKKNMASLPGIWHGSELGFCLQDKRCRGPPGYGSLWKERFLPRDTHSPQAKEAEPHSLHVHTTPAKHREFCWNLCCIAMKNRKYFRLNGRSSSPWTGGLGAEKHPTSILTLTATNKENESRATLTSKQGKKLRFASSNAYLK